MHLIKTAQHALNSEVTDRMKTILLIVAVASAGMVGAAKFRDAWVKTDQQKAKQAFVSAVAGTREFARIAVNAKGLIVRWNAGATAEIGWSADDMLGRPGARLDPHDPGAGALTPPAVFSVHEFPWTAEGGIRLRCKDGAVRTFDVAILDTGGKEPFREITLRPRDAAEPSAEPQP